MKELALYEMICEDSECGKISLQEVSINSVQTLDIEYENLCPYCGERTNYTTGKIEPVLFYTPRSERKTSK